jgi:hypothetical protein
MQLPALITNIFLLSTFTSTVTNVCVATAGAKRARHEPRDVILGRQTTVVPSSIPAYASACSGSVGYSSACSCLGVTASTTTAPTPSTTITVTTTSTVAPPTLTVIQFFDFDCVGEQTITPAPYGVCTETDASNSTSFLSFSGDAATAAACTVNFYEGLSTNCEGPTFGSAPVTSTQCIDFSQIGDIELVCPSC